MNSLLNKHQALQKIFERREAKFKSTNQKTHQKPSVGFLSRIRSQEIVDFTRQVATLIAARLPLAQALEILAQQNQNTKLKNIIEDILEHVKSGDSLAISLQRHSGVFSELYIELFKYKPQKEKSNIQERTKSLKDLLKADNAQNEYETIKRALEISGFSKTKAAGLLGISRTTLWKKLNKLTATTVN